MIVWCRGGPHADTRWTYPDPLPKSLVLLDKSTLAYHEYVREQRTNTYNYVGYIGHLPVPRDLDAAATLIDCELPS